MADMLGGGVRLLVSVLVGLIVTSIIISVLYTLGPTTFNSTAHPTLVLNGTDYQSWVNWLPYIFMGGIVITFVYYFLGFIKHK
jgi:multisubunit Na+/H+ antiporter MnhB subunit